VIAVKMVYSTVVPPCLPVADHTGGSERHGRDFAHGEFALWPWTAPLVGLVLTGGSEHQRLRERPSGLPVCRVLRKRQYGSLAFTTRCSAVCAPR
jgi:hypothetical protein